MLCGGGCNEQTQRGWFSCVTHDLYTLSSLLLGLNLSVLVGHDVIEFSSYDEV